MACMEQDAMFRSYLLERPDERAKLTDEEAAYFGFKRDKLSGQWVDAWADTGADAFVAEPVDPEPAVKTAQS